MLPCSGLILRCVARRSIHLFIACVLINHTHTPFYFIFFFNVGKSKHVFPIKERESRSILWALHLHQEVMEQGSENGLIILTDGALNKPTQNTEDTKEGCTCWKCGAFLSCQKSGVWGTTLALQPCCFPVLRAGTNPFCHPLPPFPSVPPCNPPILQHLKGSSERFLCNFDFFLNAKTC